MPVLIGITLIIIVVIVANNIQQLAQKHRIRLASEKATELGLTFSPDQLPIVPAIPGGFLLFSQGIPLARQNVMEGTYKDEEIAVYQYTFVINLGKVTESFLQTVVQIKIKSNDLPQFTLCPYDQIEIIVDQLLTQEGRNALLDSSGIRLPNHPDFRSQYKLMGSEAQQLQFIFDNESVMKAFAAIDVKPFHGLICVEGAGQHLFIYPLYKQVNLKKISNFLDNAVNLAQEMQTALGTSKLFFTKGERSHQ